MNFRNSSWNVSSRLSILRIISSFWSCSHTWRFGKGRSRSSRMFLLRESKPSICLRPSVNNGIVGNIDCLLTAAELTTPGRSLATRHLLGIPLSVLLCGHGGREILL
ncbi:hypothetical protein OE88DRAFT_572452 [Heliocybe sulcata]|uniref:Uncharacterized protein n=1 Tax=Heliocybe sulcata TaxID=5364 RepID=A0A5C3MTF8_9AGAM|nr:hypothetical protein OE88DRAFT_572452 [Heliocybe sulcata]